MSTLGYIVFGLFVFGFLLICVSAIIGDLANYLIPIYRSKGIKGVLNELNIWIPVLYFLGCLIFIFRTGTNFVGIIGFLIGVLYFCIKEYIKTKRLDSFALIYMPPLAIGGLFLFTKVLQLLMSIPYFIPIAIVSFVLWFIVMAFIAFKEGK